MDVWFRPVVFGLTWNKYERGIQFVVFEVETEENIYWGLGIDFMFNHKKKGGHFSLDVFFITLVDLWF